MISTLSLVGILLLAGFVFAGALGASTQAPPLPVIPRATFDITCYGAVGDGRIMNTAAIQKAVDAAADAGGGTVRVPAGKFLTGPFKLASCINLHLQRGAVILISDDLARHPVLSNRYQDCISASEAHDVEISGHGVIDGQGAAWWGAFRSKPGMTHRPFLVRLSNCRRVLVAGVTLRNSPMFHLAPQSCTDVTIRGIHIYAPSDSPNTDGIDPSGWNFLISGCSIDTGDDNIAIKPVAKRRPGNKNFRIQNCVFAHGHGCSIGSGTAGGIEDVTVSHCTFRQTDSGIRIKTGRDRGGLLQNVTYENLKMTEVQNPIYIIDYYPERTAPKNPATEKPGPVTRRTPVNKNITIRNVTATDCATAGTIRGLPEMPIENVTLSNVSLATETGMKIYHARGVRFENSKITVRKGERLITCDAQVAGLE
ncbi:MAG: right-handed parallel beta-helix repeat-containing protein [Verrucomicrobiota bacterium]|nr:right-handed parallel beta-helix repeat-containing protein [Verrucomicrobiota bacterium]